MSTFEDFIDSEETQPMAAPQRPTGHRRRGNARKRMLWKDIRVTLAKSKGRFLSIVSLMMLGSFALVGLFATGPDMQATGSSFYAANNLADVTVISDYGLSRDDERIIRDTAGVRQAEFGYFKDVTITGSDHSLRIYSKPDAVSGYRVVEGRMPETTSEIALDSAERDRYAIDSTVKVTELPDIAGDTILKQTTYTVVGFVDASEIVSNLNMGQSTAGTGELDGYGVVVPGTFDSDVTMIGRVTFNDTQHVDYWTSEYRDLVQAHKNVLTKRLAGQPKAREAAIRSQRREQIDKAQAKVDDAKRQLTDAEQQLADAKTQIEAAKDQKTQGEIDAVNTTVEQASSALSELSGAMAQIASAGSQITAGQTQLAAGAQQLTQGQAQLGSSWQQLTQAKTQLDTARTALEAAKTVLDKIGATLQHWADSGIASGAYNSVKTQYDKALAAYNEAAAQYDSQLNAYHAALQQWNTAATQLDKGSAEYRQNAAALANAANQLAGKQSELGAAVSQAPASASAGSASAGATQLIQGSRDIEKAEDQYAEKLEEFNAAKPAAEAKIKTAEHDIELAREKVDTLEVPAYSIDGRREGLTSNGYRVYEIIANIVGKLAMIFPVFLYFVAALVTFSTMGRMVDEERVNSGTLKALGYGNADILKKFTVYGFAASTVGTILGVAAGHTILPLIVYHAYSDGFTMPVIELKFHPAVTVAAFLLAWVSAVVPAMLAAARELRDKPAALLLPKPPANGSKIFLERLGFIWNRLSFTRKVTARNLFRYKTRGFMTIFGVMGAVSLLVAGLGVQGSINKISERQFDEVVHYDMIVAERSDNNDEQREVVAKAMTGKAVDKAMPIRYEKLTKTAGKTNDKQSITLLVTDDAYNFDDYVTLRSRVGHRPQILTDRGAVISERMASMLGAKAGDTIRVVGEDGTERSVRVDGVSEMYIGHLMVMSSGGYEHVFGEDYRSNAYLVRLKDNSIANAEKQGARFMTVDGVRGVVQNTTMKNQVATIVDSLNQIMEVLVLVAAMLAIVILYNLTNLNVSERIRELSTIKVLGFHSNETTMYIYRETIVLSALGILAGYGFGAGLHRYIITEVPPDEVMFDPTLGWPAFVVPAVLVAMVLAALGVVVYRQLRDVDMLAALKSVE
ncbi:FtsX-like permease family protein [Bifidobacterium leontopitheci]|uniref:Cell division protein FtsX n=1 Tax=Bifidobacterium leontopitheci TaxID=2650774 RepID=A0A6I1GSW5_9BIFI|nr:FtsX-like permease family protein [Bifidobacterium leontopitheci]KAB7791278.1 cell division protein FtsX [Bifidobacterium leontopitheci]